MSKYGRYSYLWKQSHYQSYYFRCLIPDDLVSVLKRRVILLSLQSGILKESVFLSRHLYDKCQEIFLQLRTVDGLIVAVDEIKTLLRKENLRYKSILQNNKMKDWSKDEIGKFISDRINSMKENTFEFELELRSEKKQKERVKEIDRFIRRLENDFSQGNYKYVEKKLDEDLEKIGSKVSKGSKTYTVLLSNYSKLLLESIKFRQDVRTGKEKNEYDFVGEGFTKNDVTPLIPNEQTVLQPRETDVDPTIPKIQEVFDNYLEETEGQVTDKTLERRIQVFKLFIEINGNIPITKLEQHTTARYTFQQFFQQVFRISIDPMQIFDD